MALTDSCDVFLSVSESALNRLAPMPDVTAGARPAAEETATARRAAQPVDLSGHDVVVQIELVEPDEGPRPQHTPGDGS